MLVGQNVPYRRQVEVSDNEKMAWTKLRSRLAQFADAGIGMSEYLSKLRQGQASLPHAQNGYANQPRLTHPGTGRTTQFPLAQNVSARSAFAITC